MASLWQSSFSANVATVLISLWIMKDLTSFSQHLHKIFCFYSWVNKHFGHFVFKLTSINKVNHIHKADCKYLTRFLQTVWDFCCVAAWQIWETSLYVSVYLSKHPRFTPPPLTVSVWFPATFAGFSGASVKQGVRLSGLVCGVLSGESMMRPSSAIERERERYPPLWPGTVVCVCVSETSGTGPIGKTWQPMEKRSIRSRNKCVK